MPADRSLANNFVAACKQFVSRLHAAGVVHGDLYISIFAWRLCAGVMEVEVFDWDIAFFIHKHIPQKLAETWRHTKKWSGRYDRLRVVPGPVDVGGVPAADGGVAAVVAGYHSNVLLTAAGGAYAWGWGAHGQLGVGDTADSCGLQGAFLMVDPLPGRTCRRRRRLCLELRVGSGARPSDVQSRTAREAVAVGGPLPPAGRMPRRRLCEA